MLISSKLISEINNGIHEHYGLAPKFIEMNRKSYEELKKEYDLEKNFFYGIPIRITNIEKEFELKYYVDPINKEK